MRRLAAVAALLTLAGSCAAAPSSTDQAAVGASSTTAPRTTTIPTATTVVTTTTAIVDPDPDWAPWSAPAVAGVAAPNAFVDQWNQAENRRWCSALFPDDPVALGSDATLRPAAFAGGWAVAWDRPQGPGRMPSGEYCEDCGRGAFGVAGTGLRAAGDEPDRWPTVIEYSDGSRVGYGFEGDADPTSGAPLLAYLLVKDEGCLYNAWSFLGEDHLLTLVGRLRRVEGLEGEPTPWVSELPVPPTVDLGDPPWTAEPLDPSSVPRAAHDEWVEAGSPPGCPMLAFADLGEAAGATARRATNSGEMLVAWDLPGAPGHHGDSTPCEDCGRGVIGLGTFQFSSFEGPVAYSWSDGSEARLRTGPVTYGAEVFVRVDGFACDYWVWSHLGDEHLLHLLTQLRRVAEAP